MSSRVSQRPCGPVPWPQTRLLEARKAAQAETEPTPVVGKLAPGTPSATVTSLHEWRLAHLPTDTRPLPSVAPYDQLLRRRRTSGSDHREGEAQ